MTKRQQEIQKEKIKQFFRATLPPAEAESAINAFEATIAAKQNDKETLIKLLQQWIPTKSVAD